EVAVTRPITRLDPSIKQTKAKPGSVLAKADARFFASKYLGNSILTNSKNLGYTGTITLGSNPPQSFDVVFDTGSDMIVVTSDLCRGSHCSDMTHYTCTSCSKTPYFRNISYGDGTWGNGPIVLDTVSVGGLVVQNQQILDVTRSGLDLSSYGTGISGLVGLMPSSPIIGVVPPLISIFKSNLLDMNVFSVYLTPTLQKKQGGSFLFGGIDSTKFVGVLNQVPTSTSPGVREGMWSVDADNAFVGDRPVKGYSKTPWLFDTGTSFIAVPSSFAEAFHSEIPGAEYSAADKLYTVPCAGNTTFGVSFNGIKYDAPYTDYVALTKPGSSLCVSLVMPLENCETYILGDPFLRQIYAVYDFTPGKSRIGIAKIDVTNASLGLEGLSGDPIPGGTVISPSSPSIGQSQSETMVGRTTIMIISLGVTAAIVVIAA
ncbi:hypothetical protein BGX27_009010, partial [Mortierella sp. AM989]